MQKSEREGHTFVHFTSRSPTRFSQWRWEKKFPYASGRKGIKIVVLTDAQSILFFLTSPSSRETNLPESKLLRFIFFYQSLTDMGDRKYPTPVVFSSLHVGKRNTKFKPHIAFFSYLGGKRNWEVAQYTQYNNGHSPAAQVY